MGETQDNEYVTGDLRGLIWGEAATQSKKMESGTNLLEREIWKCLEKYPGFGKYPKQRTGDTQEKKQTREVIRFNPGAWLQLHTPWWEHKGSGRKVHDLIKA